MLRQPRTFGVRCSAFDVRCLFFESGSLCNL